MNVKEFLEAHVRDWGEYEFEGKAFNSFGFSTGIKPSEYLKYANTDLQTDYDHSRINALSNAKRAIDCQVDNLLAAFGLKRHQFFPEKIEAIASLGLIAPRILRKVVKIRNRLEHEYYNPTQDEVEDSIDIAHLFVSATSWPLGNFMSAFFVAKKGSENDGDREKRVDEILNEDYRIRGYTYTESIFVEFDEEEKCFYIDCVSNNTAVVELEVASNHKAYASLMAYTIANHHDHPEWNEEDSVRDFVEWLNENAGHL